MPGAASPCWTILLSLAQLNVVANFGELERSRLAVRQSDREAGSAVEIGFSEELCLATLRIRRQPAARDGDRNHFLLRGTVIHGIDRYLANLVLSASRWAVGLACPRVRLLFRITGKEEATDRVAGIPP